MELPHLRALAQARSHLAALADGAQSVEASSAYERVLLDLDRIHGDESPALDAKGLTDDRAVLYAGALTAIDELTDYGIDALDVELVLAKLEDARALDRS